MILFTFELGLLMPLANHIRGPIQTSQSSHNNSTYETITLINITKCGVIIQFILRTTCGHPLENNSSMVTIAKISTVIQWIVMLKFHWLIT